MLATTEPRKLRVLVVDDDMDTVVTTATLLRLCGNDVTIALRGIDAIDCTTQFQPDVVMLDIGMPGVDGYQAAREIQRLVLPKPPVLIAVSGYGDIQAQRQAAEAGFDLHLLKPVPADVFEDLHVLIEETERVSTVHAAPSMEGAALTVQHQQAMSTLMISFIQTARTMLYVAGTTQIEGTREPCMSKARRICDRLSFWIWRYPEQLGEVSDDLEDLIRRMAQ